MTAAPAVHRVALKEWASVCLALERGRQLVLIRKGGLAEPGQGFEFRADRFLFYPTYEHQTGQFLRDDARPLFDESMALRPRADTLSITLYAEVVTSALSSSAETIRRLEPFHIYNEAFLSQRLQWQPEQPLVIGIVRAFRLPAERSLRLQPHYRGCTSWVELDEPIDVANAKPVIETKCFEEQRRRIEAFMRDIAPSAPPAR